MKYSWLDKFVQNISRKTWREDITWGT